MKSRLQSTLIASACLIAVVPATNAQAQNKPAAKPAAAKPAVAVAAEVNGEKIMMADVNRMLDSIKTHEPSLAGNTEQAKKALVQVRSTVVDNLIEQILMVQEAKRRKINPKPDDVNKALDDFRKRFGDEAKFKAALTKEGKSVEDLKKLIVEGMQVYEVGQQLTADVTVTDDEAAKFYRDNIAEFQLPEAVNARHILLAVAPNATKADKDKVKARAQDLLKKAQAQGVDFAKLAQENSDDTGSKQEGGSLGYFSRDDMVKPFADAAFAATPGKVVGPVETQFGYHIIKIDDKKAAGAMPLDQAKELIKPGLLDEKRKKRLEQKLTELKTKAKIKKNV
jgi:peptidyl-prolyl cis-trans isomerase C